MINKVLGSFLFAFMISIVAFNAYSQPELELLQASDKGDSAKVLELLNAGANANTAYDDGETALMLACRGNHSFIVKALVEHAALINTRSEFNHSALLYVVGRGNLDLTRYLVSKGADTKKEAAQLLIFAANRSHVDVLRYLVEELKINVNTQNSEGNYSLIAAVIGGNIEVVKYLIRNGANLNLKDDTKTADYKNLSLYGTPLIHAVTSGKMHIAKFLADTGANLNIKTNSGYSALMLAIILNKFDIARYLIDKGADVNDQDANGYSVLMQAGIQVKFDLVKLLIEKGANVNLPNSKGKNILDVLEVQAGIQKQFNDNDVYKMTKLLMKYLQENGAVFSKK